MTLDAKTRKIKFGDGMSVIDEGHGVIRVEAGGGGGGSLTWEDVGDLLAAPIIVQLKVIRDTSMLASGDGQLIFAIPEDLDGLKLASADAYITTASSSGVVTVQLRNVTDSVDMLSTRVTIDVGEFTSYSAVTAPVVDTAHDDVTTGDLISVDVDVAGTGSKGLGVILTFS